MKWNEDKDIETEWFRLCRKLQSHFDKKPDLNGILFLMGIQELGQGIRTFSKDEKQDLMHMATCKALSYAEYYELEGKDEDGWVHWKLIKPLPILKIEDQEKLLKMNIITYFKEEVFKDEQY
ncbi:MAG: hypothetical protein COZ18_06170 [Flexibacter sp. CG_4_10_14_3_um_filter_32_15]|nr:MAG: hypothetical protein COZ18_06170 [Flexibacter sp. CG_4_10_14_3_um_filter_32_15]